MTETYFPFASGPGASSGQDRWSKMASNWVRDGVVASSFAKFSVGVGPGAVLAANVHGRYGGSPPAVWGGLSTDLLPFGDSSGMQVKVPAGEAVVRGFFYQNDAQIILAIAANASGQGRIDRVVLRLDTVGDAMHVAVVTGTPSTNPTPPALTQNSSTWEIALAEVTVYSGVSTITALAVRDARTIANRGAFVSLEPGNGPIAATTPELPCNVGLPFVVPDSGAIKIRMFIMIGNGTGGSGGAYGDSLNTAYLLTKDRIVEDAVLNGSTTITSAHAGFDALRDLGPGFAADDAYLSDSGGLLPGAAGGNAGVLTALSAVGSSTSATMDHAATGSASPATVLIQRQWANLTGTGSDAGGDSFPGGDLAAGSLLFACDTYTQNGPVQDAVIVGLPPGTFTLTPMAGYSGHGVDAAIGLIIEPF